MDLAKLEKASKIYEEIKLVDAKIIALEKLANMRDGFGMKISISLEKDKELSKMSFCEPIEISHRSISEMYGLWSSEIKKQEPQKERHCIEEFVDEKHFFLFINYMMQQYDSRRNFLIKKLELLNA